MKIKLVCQDGVTRDYETSDTLDLYSIYEFIRTNNDPDGGKDNPQMFTEGFANLSFAARVDDPDAESTTSSTSVYLHNCNIETVDHHKSRPSGSIGEYNANIQEAHNAATPDNVYFVEQIR